MGIEKGKVKLENYNNDWSNEFQKEKVELEKLLGNIAKSIEHIGSTAIIGIKAKPVIDIAIGVDNFQDFLDIQDKFKDYTLKIDLDNDEVLIKKGTEKNTTHFIHLMEITSKRYIESIIFRDYLNKYDNYKEEYQKLKEDLAIKYADDRPSYTKSKNSFINETLKLAWEEYNNGNL